MEPLLGGPGFTPATPKEREEFQSMVRRLSGLSDEEMERIQYIEWKLTESEYVDLKFGQRTKENYYAQNQD